MSVGVLLITHSAVGRALIDTATAIIGSTPLPVEVLPAPLDCDPIITLAQAKERIQALNSGDGVLVLTDMYGSTPSNIAFELLKESPQVSVITGVNLPMLIRILNYPNLELDALTQKALSGGQEGIMSNRKDSA